MPRQFSLSVRPSVTRVICVKTAERIIEILSLSDRPIILVFRHENIQYNSLFVVLDFADHDLPGFQRLTPMTSFYLSTLHAVSFFTSVGSDMSHGEWQAWDTHTPLSCTTRHGTPAGVQSRQKRTIPSEWKATHKKTKCRTKNILGASKRNKKIF